MNISLALETLRNAPSEDLRDHINEAVATFREIEARLKDVCSPHHEIIHEVTSVEQPTSRENVDKTVPTRAMKLLDALNKTSHWTIKSIKLQPEHVLRLKRPFVLDRRLADIHRVEGDPKAKNKSKMVRGLAQRSLALQGERAGFLDVENMCEIASCMRKKKVNRGRQGTISSYVTDELAIQEEDKSFATRAVQAGMRQLVVERMLKKRLEGEGYSTTASGISAFTALAVRPFRSLNYSEIPEFLDLLLGSTSIDSSLSEGGPATDGSPPVSIADIIQETSVWFDRLQTHYDKFVDPCTLSEEQRLGSLLSPLLSNNRSMSHPPDSPEHTLRSSHEMDNSRESDVLASLRGVSPGISDAGGALNAAQLHTSAPSSSANVHGSRAKAPRYNTAGVLARADPYFSDSLANSAFITHVDGTANQYQSPCQPTTNQITPAPNSPPINDSSEQSFSETLTTGSLSNAVDISSPGSDTYSHRFRPSTTNQPGETYTSAEELGFSLDEQPRNVTGQSGLGSQAETDVNAPRLNVQFIEPLYDPRFNIQPIDLLYDPRFNIQPIEPLYDPRFNIQPIEPLYDPRFNIQPIEPLYDPRFNMQPIDFVYDPHYNPQPIDPLCDSHFNLQIVGLHDSRFTGQSPSSPLDVQPVLDPPFSAQSSQFHQSSSHTQQVTPGIQNELSAIDSRSPDQLGSLEFSNPHEPRPLSSSAQLTRVLECSA
ncbi:uncharacterized protein N7511_001735 [Penicillium nucicola]|uniref:uncharacterized protein n=1 Tax=Penicillium nucicola TaxID=1850975 RepID=UPI0025453300|nr:uncharacterized protein N7511_001735 [Penicillium nucicola]KAJ5776724.1 hypothetical protein N7511_001735 [Penicillium nucicola]